MISSSEVATPNASVVDLFCGAGGLSHGFKREAFKLAAGIDIDETCRFPYEANNGAPFLRKDVGKLTAKEIDDLFLPCTKRVAIIYFTKQTPGSMVVSRRYRHEPHRSDFHRR